MIVDHIKNLHKYTGLNRNIQTVIEFIENKDLRSIAVGKHKLTDEINLLREDYSPRPLEDCYFESHKVYGDIQLVVDGFEYFGYLEANDPKFIVTSPYDSSKDVTKGQSTGDFSKVLLTKGMFAMVLEDELHMPKLSANEPVEVVKAVFKIKL